MNERTEHFVVTPEEAGQRLDQCVREHLPELSRRVLSELFASGRVRVDGHFAPKGQRTRANSVVTVTVVEDAAPPNADLGLAIVAECDDWVAIDKPAGLPSAARDGRDGVNVASALLARYPRMNDFGYHAREAGLVHRLDTFTSGLLLAAKTARAFEELRSALREGRIKKRYLAIAGALPFDSGTISAELDPGPRAKVMATSLQHVAAGGTLSASATARETRYRVVQRVGELSLVELEVNAAYRHQIRAHLAAVGCPIIGDALYGSDVELPRHALHASHLSYPGGDAAQFFSLDAPLPAELLALLA